MALTQYYVDPAINANSGTGTSGDPYGDLQYALNSITRDATNGDQINIKAGTAEVLSAVLSLATYGTPAATAPLVLRGYTSAANDGGQGEINANGGAAIPSSVCHLRDLNIHNGGSSTLVTLGNGGSMHACRVADTSGTGVITNLASVCFNEITDCGTGVNASAAGCFVYGNYFKFGGTRNFTQAVTASGSGALIERNIISVGTSGSGIICTNPNLRIIGNSILANGSTGDGIAPNSASIFSGLILQNNIIEGFSGAGGAGFAFSSTNAQSAAYRNNAAYNNTTNYENVGDVDDIENIDNEVLAVSPFAKSGSDTFANRFVYFAPVDTGNVHGGAS